MKLFKYVFLGLLIIFNSSILFSGILKNCTTQLKEFFPKDTNGQYEVFLEYRDTLNRYFPLEYEEDYVWNVIDNSLKIPQIIQYNESDGKILSHPSSILFDRLEERDAVIKVILGKEFTKIKLTGRGYTKSNGSVEYRVYLGYNNFENPILKFKDSTDFETIININDIDTLFFLTNALKDDFNDHSHWEKIEFEAICPLPNIQFTGETVICTSRDYTYYFPKHKNINREVNFLDGKILNNNGDSLYTVNWNNKTDNQIVVYRIDTESYCSDTTSIPIYNQTTIIKIDSTKLWVCENAQSKILDICLPNGGKYYGEYVSNDTFYIKKAGVGVHKIYYEKSNEFCDSKIEININVIEAPEKPKITMFQKKLYSSYDKLNQWYFFDSLLVNETNQIYIPIIDGMYRVKSIDENGCESVFSDYFAYEFSSIYENNFAIIKELEVYPNPANEALNVSEYYIGNEYVIKNILGQVIKSDYAETSLINIKNLKSGLYFLSFPKLTARSIQFVKID